MPARSSSTRFAWADVLLAAMGLVLVCGFTIGLLSSIPLRVAGGTGSVLATAMWAGSVAMNPDERTA